MSSYLTKSAFVHALDCPTKLYYHQNESYKSRKEENDFLNALARGGLQVGELAKLYYPGGTEIAPGKEKEVPLRETAEHLRQGDCVLYEAAFRHASCFVLADIVIREGDRLKVIEVKSKSWEPGESFVSSRSGRLKSGWQEYLFDVAFQSWVVRRAWPEFEVAPYLMLVDKSRKATVDGLHQFFRVVEEDGRYRVKVKEGVTPEDLGDPILRAVPVGEAVDQVLRGEGREPRHELEAAGFGEWVTRLSEYLRENEKYPVTTGKKCKDCEYRVDPDTLEEGERSGFAECWRQAHGWGEEELEKPHVFDIWNERNTGEMLEKGARHMEDLVPGDLEADPGALYEQEQWDRGQRKTVQIVKATGYHPGNETVLSGLFREMRRWTYPLHFIDFEAVTPAIPFHKGQRPYRKTPFQFSCHKVYEDGRAEHSAEWIERRPGAFPCFRFIRRLREALETEGSVFMYHHFENTVLNDVATLLEERRPDDADELIGWIGTLTRGGERAMIDQQRLVVDYYYSPHMGGSNSIKEVLPAVLTESPRLREIYSQPYSGLSIKEKVFYREEETGRAVSPYRLLDPIGHGLPDYETGEEYVADGGTAMMAWSRMQFDDVPEEERAATFQALLEYCELDTLAMVMLYQHWKYLGEK